MDQFSICLLNHVMQRDFIVGRIFSGFSRITELYLLITELYLLLTELYLLLSASKK